MGIGFVFGLLLGFTLVVGFLLWLNHVDGKEFERAKELFKDVAFDDFEIYDTELVTDIRMDDGTEYGRTFSRLNREGAFNCEGFMHIDDYELAIDKIVSIKEYQIAKARAKLADDNTYEFQRVVMDAFGNIEDIYTSNILKEQVIGVYPDSKGDLRVGLGSYTDIR
ncbi:hypothetical protein [Mammaliicoccus lentus]|uniref:hypothetical protein n=1 Tax=Mammaliicoccus lentus TaxID=42858 RepID=UPI001071F716|nr:hypothetical protein [Mammaliicoccus lentus]MBF0793359.1 hypothetical protein [Mammaliicoccus lentus]TFV17860.1 hypothetical protein E4T78_01750 [Mammaliicoccus lentus]